jgi:hypothetical protein
MATGLPEAFEVLEQFKDRLSRIHAVDSDAAAPQIFAQDKK